MKMQALAERAEQLQVLLAGVEYSGIDFSPSDSSQSMPISGHGQVGCDLAVQLLSVAREQDANVFLVGNGGSAAIVSHAKTDLMNVGKIKAITLHESAIMTCLSNDYGYEHVFSRQLEVLAKVNDVLIAVSSSGASQNILNAVEKMREKQGKIITLSGFQSSNPLRELGDLNYWIDSSNYTLVEIAHLFILHHLADCLKNRE